MTRLLPLALLCACAPPGSPALVRGVLLAPAQRTTATLVGRCTGIDARPVADRVLVALAVELVRSKRASYDQVRAALERPLQLCVVAAPEPCCNAGGCRGPYRKRSDGVIQAARKAGCADAYSAWASDRWPPVCDDLLGRGDLRAPWLSWPDEPHCVQRAEGQGTGPAVWGPALAVELTNVIKLRVLQQGDPEHKLSPDLYRVAREAL